MNMPHEGGEVFQMQIIWALELRLSKQRTNKHHANYVNSKVDRQICGLTHQGPHCLNEQQREEDFGRRR
jgi:hypothetical protein